MMFEKKSPIDIAACPSCKATGLAGFRKCGRCRGMSMGRFQRGKWLYWSYPLTRYNLALLNGRRIFNKIRRITSIALWLNFWAWAGFFIYQSGLFFGMKYFPSPVVDRSAACFESMILPEDPAYFSVSITLVSFPRFFFRLLQDFPNQPHSMAFLKLPSRYE